MDPIIELVSVKFIFEVQLFLTVIVPLSLSISILYFVIKSLILYILLVYEFVQTHLISQSISFKLYGLTLLLVILVVFEDSLMIELVLTS